MSDTLSMRAVVLREPGVAVRVETVLLEPPRRGEVLVRVAAAGVLQGATALVKDAEAALKDIRIGRVTWFEAVVANGFDPNAQIDLASLSNKPHAPLLGQSFLCDIHLGNHFNS